MSDYGHDEAMRDLGAMLTRPHLVNEAYLAHDRLAAYIEKMERELGWANVTIEAMHDMSTWDAEKEAELASLRSQHERDEAVVEAAKRQADDPMVGCPFCGRTTQAGHDEDCVLLPLSPHERRQDRPDRQAARQTVVVHPLPRPAIHRRERDATRRYPMTEPTELHELGEDVPLCRLCVRRIYETCPLEPSENVAVCTEYAPFGGTPNAAGVVWVPSSDCTCPWKYCGETDRDENPPNPCSFGHRPVPRASAPTTCPTCGSDDPKVRRHKHSFGDDWGGDDCKLPYDREYCPDSFHATQEVHGFVLPAEQSIIDARAHLRHGRPELAMSVLDAAHKAIKGAEYPKVVSTPTPVSDDAVETALGLLREAALYAVTYGRGRWTDEEVSALVATLEAAIHQRDERIGELEGKGVSA